MRKLLRRGALLLGATAVLSYLGLLALSYFTHDVTEANYRQLEIGMTKWQVRRLIGIWPDRTHHWVKGQVHEDWCGDEGGMMLAFDNQNRLIWKDWDEKWKREARGPFTLEGLFISLGWIKVRDG